LCLTHNPFPYTYRQTMNTRADKTTENRSSSVTNSSPAPESTGEAVFSFEDNRPEAVAQRKLQETINGSAQVKQLKTSQGMADQYAAQNTTGMPDQLKTGIESLSGMSMDHVKVHYNSGRPSQINALAYAQGSDIHIGPGQEQHLPHEAWHVVQQAQGRVPATMQLKEDVSLNDDEHLEQEADRMGALALATTGSKGVLQQRRTTGNRSVVQLVKPGGIEHATNSCFVAALINTFTVVRPLRNLLIPTNNVLVGADLLQLQDLLWRAVNSVDRTDRVTRHWVQLIMASLTQNNIIDNAVDTADFSSIMARVVTALTPGGGNHGQANGMPVSTGEVAWYQGQTLETAVYHTVEQMQNGANDFNLAPNSVHVTRGVGNQLLAPQTFNLYPADGSIATYRLRSIVERSGKYVGGHFISHIDRGAGGQEWWRSDDLNPGGVGRTDIQTSNMRRQGYAYIYERSDSALVVTPQSPGVLVDRTVPALKQLYEKNLKTYLQKEVSFGKKEPVTIDFSKVDLNKVDLSKFDKDIQKRKKEDPTLTLANVARKIELFNECNRKEKKEIGNVNLLLTHYSRLPTLDIFEMVQLQMAQARERIREIHTEQAELLGQYMASASEEAKLAFLTGIIPEFEKSDGELFRLIAGRVTREDGQSDEDFQLLRNRYLAYIAQGLGTQTGKNRLVEFGDLLGKRLISLGMVGAEFMAGFSDLGDINKGQKEEDRVPEDDLELLKEVDGNIPAFIEARFGSTGEKVARTPNKQAGETGTLDIRLERGMHLFPVFLGKGEEGVELFSSPLFAAMHHETGHIVNYLKGMSGGKNKYGKDGPLSVLTDEEEIYNISLDRYSDKVLSQEMHLPERIAHKAFTGLSNGVNTLSEKETFDQMQQWRGLTGQTDDSVDFLREKQLEIADLATDDKAFHEKLAVFVVEMGQTITWLDSGEVSEDQQRLANFIAWCLDQLEHKVYARLNAIQQGEDAIADPKNDEFRALGDDLDLIQEQHRRYIASIIENKLQLWVRGTVEEWIEANEDWNGVLENKRGIRIEKGSSPEFRNETYANIAKLLSRQNGRKLVHSLLSAGNALEIRTPDPEVIDRMRKYLIGQGDSPEAVEKALVKEYGGMAGPERGKGNLHGVKKGPKGLERNSGLRSTMSMRTGLKDSESTSVDRHGKLIFSPNFIELGHEMIHALQNIRGANVKDVNEKAYAGSSWENMSEHSVITGTDLMKELLDTEYMTENLLREDHGLGVRHGHNTAIALQEAIAVKFCLLARDKRWDKKGGTFTKDKTPKGIQLLRALLVQQPTLDWTEIQKVVHDRATRYDFTKSLLSVDETVTAFYTKIDEFCDLREKIATDEDALREYLVRLDEYSPF
jgi:hypothetical protein